MTGNASRRLWTFSNVMSASRVLLPIPLWYFLFEVPEGGRLGAAVVILFAVLTDFLDGYFARRLHQVTEAGKIFDPVADKIAVGFLAVFLVVLGDLPLWYVVVIVARDLLILAGGIAIRAKKKIIPQSNMMGKVAVTLVAAVLFLATVRVDSLRLLQDLLLWSSVVVMAISLGVYVGRMFVGVRPRKEGTAHGV